MEENEDVVIRYGVKELLAIQGKTLERIESKVDASALSQAEINAKVELRLARLEDRPDLETRVLALETSSSESRGETNYRRWASPVRLYAASVAVSIVALVITFLDAFHKF